MWRPTRLLQIRVHGWAFFVHLCWCGHTRVTGRGAGQLVRMQMEGYGLMCTRADLYTGAGRGLQVEGRAEAGAAGGFGGGEASVHLQCGAVSRSAASTHLPVQLLFLP